MNEFNVDLGAIVTGLQGVGISNIAFKKTDTQGNNVYTITLDDNNTYDFTANKGDKGEQGVQGIQGEQGVQGEQGIQGIQGEAGLDLTVPQSLTDEKKNIGRNNIDAQRIGTKAIIENSSTVESNEIQKVNNLKITGTSSQTGTPTALAPIAIKNTLDFNPTNQKYSCDINLRDGVASKTVSIEITEPLMAGNVLDVNNKKIHRVRNQYSLTGDEAWGIGNGLSGSYFYCTCPSAMADIGNTVATKNSEMCSHYPITNPYSESADGILGLYVADSLKQIRLKDSRFTTVAQLKAWLKTTKVVLEYDVKTPYEVDVVCDNVDWESDGTTTVSTICTNPPSVMEVEYNVNLTNWIANVENTIG